MLLTPRPLFQGFSTGVKNIYVSANIPRNFSLLSDSHTWGYCTSPAICFEGSQLGIKQIFHAPASLSLSAICIILRHAAWTAKEEGEGGRNPFFLSQMPKSGLSPRLLRLRPIVRRPHLLRDACPIRESQANGGDGDGGNTIPSSSQSHSPSFQVQ